MARVGRRMSAVDFATIEPLLKNFSRDRVEAARRALVEGQTQKAVGASYGWTQQAVSDLVSDVWKHWTDYQTTQGVAASSGALLPPGWEQVTLIAPTEMIQEFKAQLAKAFPSTWSKQAVKAAKSKKK